MTIALIVIAVLLALVLGPLILTGDVKSFSKRYGMVVLSGLAATFVGVLLYIVAEKFPIRKDLTADGKYTVNPGLLNIVKKLDDQVQIVYYVYSHSQSFIPIETAIVEKLSEIKNATNGMVDYKVEEVDAQDKNLIDELQSHQFITQRVESGGDSQSLQLFISGMKITYKDKDAAYIPQVGDPNHLEYDLGEQLLELHVKDKPSDKPIIAVNLPPSGQGFKVPGQPQKGSGFEWMVDERVPVSISNKKYEVKQIELSANSKIPEKTALLILVRPNLVDERARYEVAKYLAEGGKVLLLANPIRTTTGDAVEQTPFGLEDYLKECGVSLGKAIVADKSHFSVAFRPGEYVSYFIRIKAENIDQSTALTRLMPGLMMPAPVEIILDNAALTKNGITPTVLAKTTEQNWIVEPSPYGDLKRDKRAVEGPGEDAPPKAVFALLKGQFPFPYEGKPVPEWPNAEKDKSKDPKDAKDGDKDKKDKPAPVMATAAKQKGTLVLCSAPEAFYAPYLGDGSANIPNIALLLNITESMSNGDDLISLRTNHYETRTISNKLAGEDKKTLRLIWKVLLILGMPVAILYFAIYRFILRRVSQLTYERKFAGTIGPSSFSA